MLQSLAGQGQIHGFRTGRCDARTGAIAVVATSLFTIPVTTIDGATTTLEPWQGQVLLIVNVASQCGFTPQYEGLEALHRAHADKGLAVLGFPCDQFGHQEPGDEAEIREFCRLTYDVTFPLFAKLEVNGPGTHPLYRELKRARRGFMGTGAIKWNFTKFVVDRSGEVVQRHPPTRTPSEFEPELLKLL